MIAFTPMRPIALTLPVLAIPATSVPNSSGAMIDLISRRKMLLTGVELRSRCAARRNPERNARRHSDEDPGGQRQALQRSPQLSFSRSTSKNIMRGGRIS